MLIVLVKSYFLQINCILLWCINDSFGSILSFIKYISQKAIFLIYSITTSIFVEFHLYFWRLSFALLWISEKGLHKSFNVKIIICVYHHSQSGYVKKLIWPQNILKTFIPVSFSNNFLTLNLLNFLVNEKNNNTRNIFHLKLNSARAYTWLSKQNISIFENKCW